MSVVVLVHGIAQEQRAADVLEEEWLPPLAGGVRQAGYPDLADRLWRDRSSVNGIDARMAFYGGLFLQPDQQGISVGELSPDEQVLAEELAEAWLERAARRMESRPAEKALAQRELAYVRRQLGDEEMGRGAVLRSAIASVARLHWFAPTGMALAERFVNRALVQVTRYFSDQVLRDAIVGTVLALCGPETKVMVGHSLGSVAAYEASHQLAYRLPALITLGSPLGLDTIVYPRLRPQPPTFPPLVQRWVNVADREDFIAAEPDLTAQFSQGAPSGAFDASYTVDNGAEPHRATFYLAKQRVGAVVAEALSK